MRLRGKVAVVTGAAAGLGQSVASRFAREGAEVILADRDASQGTALAKHLLDDGGRVVFCRTDIAQEAQVENLVRFSVEHFGRVDVLYNNAAVLFHDRDARAHELSLEVWDCIMQVNLRGLFLCSKYVIPLMLKQGGGSIVHLGSPTGFLGCAPTLTAYSASKGGVLGLTRVMAASYARDNIRVNAIIPGTMDTPMNAKILVDGAARVQFVGAIPMGRLGSPEDIEGLAVFLASDESAYCTGGFYTCDGGLTAV